MSRSIIEAHNNFKLVIVFFLLLLFSKSFAVQSVAASPDSLIFKGYQCLKKKDTACAITCGELALELCKKQNNLVGSTNSLLLLARVYKSQDKFSTTLDCYLQALAKSEYISDKKLQSLVTIEIGDLYYESELYQKSLDYFLNADTNSIDLIQQIKLFKNLGNAYEKVKKYEEALYYYKRVLTLYEEGNLKKQVPSVLIVLSDLCKKLNKYKEAAYYETQNLSLRKEHSDTIAIAASLNNLGTIYKYLGQNSTSLDYFLQSYNLKLETKDQQGMPITCTNIGIMYQLLQDYDKSLEYLNNALKIYKLSGRKREVAHSLNLISTVYCYKKNYLKAETIAIEAIEYGKEAHANDLLESSFKILSQIYKIQGNNDAALEYYQRYSDIKDSITLQQSIQQKELYLKYLEMENKEAQIKDLRIEKELKDLEYKKLQLENEKKGKEWEILKRDKDIQEITLKQQRLQQEKAINLLRLHEQQYRADASDKELKLLKQQQFILDAEKQNKIQALKAKAEINELKLSKRESELGKQKIVQGVLIGLFIILAIIMLLEFNRYKLKQKAAQGKLANKNLAIEQKLLRSQMNPHFIFNALNSIQSFVTMNETYEAERYLAKFSRLMRYILDNTTHTYIPISKEVKTLELYLELEQLRFDSKFDFAISVDEDIESELALIPPMLTQPFVENSIIHGIVHKKDRGVISIQFYRRDEFIICAIEDDGIGRDAALAFNKNTQRLHRSLGMQLTKDRLALLKDISGANYQAHIIDLKDDNGDSIGTRVELQIEYKENNLAVG